MAETIFAERVLGVADPERALTFSYAPRPARTALVTLWALDETLGAILRSGRDPMVSQLRLTWWHEALCRLDDMPPPAQPMLQAIAEALLPRGITGTSLAPMIDGWEALLDPDPIDDAALATYAAARGGGLFAAAGKLLGAGDDPVEIAGQGWALVDLARHASDAALASRALGLARPMLDAAMAKRWHSAGRPVGMLAALAAIDARVLAPPLPPQGSPMRVLRMMRHRFTGR